MSAYEAGGAMILKHRDRELLRFDWVKPFGVCHVELNAGEVHNLPPDRLKAIQYFLHKRIDEVLRLGARADDLLNITKKHDTLNTATSTSTERSLGEQILGTIRLFPFVTRKRLAEMYQVSPATIARQLKALQSTGKLRRVGAKKNGQWEVRHA